MGDDERHEVCLRDTARAMSRENAEVVKAFFVTWNDGDRDVFRSLIDPDVIGRMPDGWPEQGPFVGREPVMRQIERMRETWDGDALEPLSDFIDAGDRIVVRLRWRTAGRGPVANVEATGVYTVREGRVVAIDHFWDHADALKAVGLEE